MKTLKKYSLLALTLLILSTVSEAQIVLATIKKDKSKKEAAPTVASTDSTGVKQLTAAPAQEEPVPAPSLVLSGSIDVYARTAFGSIGTGGYGPGTAFANLKGFSLGMANLIFSYAGPKAGFVGDLVFGPRGRDAVFSNQYTGQRIINQLYAYYKPGEVVTFNIGQFNTFLGYEVISPTLNFHYSTSYLFSWGPFNHTGIRTDFTFGNGLVAKIAVMNPTDMVEFNSVNTYTVGAQFGYAGDAGSVYLNALLGDQDGTLDTDVNENGDESAGTTFQIDLTTGWNLGEKFYLGFNTSLQTRGSGEEMTNDQIEKIESDGSDFFGLAIYPKFIISENASIGIRGEYFKVNNFHITPSPIGLLNGDGDVIAATLTGNFKVGGLTLIPEVRFDKTSENSFEKKDGEASDSMASLLLAAVYKF
jgi:hypothetical protein